MPKSFVSLNRKSIEETERVVMQMDFTNLDLYLDSSKIEECKDIINKVSSNPVYIAYYFGVYGYDAEIFYTSLFEEQKRAEINGMLGRIFSDMFGLNITQDYEWYSLILGICAFISEEYRKITTEFKVDMKNTLYVTVDGKALYWNE